MNVLNCSGILRIESGGNMTYNEALAIIVGFLDMASGMGFFEDGEVKLIDAAIDVLCKKGKESNNET